MKQVFEAGDKVLVEGTREYGVCTNNEQGGTVSFPVGKVVAAMVVKAWHDYETGKRYVAATEDGRKVYFGEFDVKVRMDKWQEFDRKREAQTLEQMRRDLDPLVKFLDGCRTDMHEPDEQDVSAEVFGDNLDNAMGDSGDGGEMVVVLKRGRKKHRVNLASLIALARKAAL